MNSAGSEQARVQWIRDVLTEYESRLLHYTVRLVGGDLDLARDLVQDAFLKLWQQDHERVAAHVGPWLFRVCRNAAMDRLRKDRRMQTLTPDSITFHQKEHSASSRDLRLEEAPEEQSRLFACVADLPEKQRDVIRLKFQGELSYREIAEVLELTVSHVGVLLHKAIRTLREQLSQHHEAPLAAQALPTKSA